MKVYYPLLGVVLLLSIGAIRADLILTGEEELNLEGVSLGEPVLNGSGCPKDSVTAFISADKKELFILFTDFLVESYGSNHTARKNCALAIPVHLPKGISMSLIKQNIEGFNFIPEGASTVLTSESFFAGQQGEVLSTRFDGALKDIFSIDTALPVETNAIGASAEDVTLRVNTSLRVKSNRRGDYALAGIASMGETENSLKYSLEFAKCSR